jgi:1,4-dihydroxy-2-naphthoate octaprenyltransferase
VASRTVDRPTLLRALVAMSRPDQLLLMVLVYAMGVLAAVAAGAPLDGSRLVLGFLAFLPVAASVHFANEYADHETDRLTTPTPFSGGSGALQRTGLPRRLALRAAAGALLVGVVGAVALWLGGVLDGVALALLAVVAVLGWQYSVPPLSLAWRGWGELDNALLGGVLLPVYGAAVAGEATLAVALAFLPFGCVVFVNLLATTWPDREADAAVGKATLATRLSPRRLRALYVAGVVATGALLAGFHGGPVPALVCWASLLAVPPLVWGAATYTRRRSPLPTVVAMVTLAAAQAGAWATVAL